MRLRPLRPLRPSGPCVGTGPCGEAGQATVELVLSLPVVLLVLLLVVQVGVVARSQVLVVDAARQGARSAAVGASVAEVSAAARATPGLEGGRLRVTVTGAGGAPGSDVAVTVRYREPTDVALVGGLLPDRELTATVTMRLEEPP